MQACLEPALERQTVSQVLLSTQAAVMMSRQLRHRQPFVRKQPQRGPLSKEARQQISASLHAAAEVLGRDAGLQATLRRAEQLSFPAVGNLLQVTRYAPQTGRVSLPSFTRG